MTRFYLIGYSTRHGIKRTQIWRLHVLTFSSPGIATKCDTILGIFGINQIAQMYIGIKRTRIGIVCQLLAASSLDNFELESRNRSL